MSAAFTPGPWVISDIAREHAIELMITTADQGDKVHICQVTTSGKGNKKTITPEQDANAQLIAAAPDLLEACKAQHKAIDLLMAMLIEKDASFLPSKSPAWPAVLQGNAAIAKATGSAA